LSGEEDQAKHLGDQSDTDEEIVANPLWLALRSGNNRNASNVSDVASDVADNKDKDEDKYEDVDTKTDTAADATVADDADDEDEDEDELADYVELETTAATDATFEDRLEHLNAEVRQLWARHLRLRAQCVAKDLI
jgi:hypothetical protein